MELSSQHGFLEELLQLAPIRRGDNFNNNNNNNTSWQPPPQTTTTSFSTLTSNNDFFNMTNEWNFDSFETEFSAQTEPSSFDLITDSQNQTYPSFVDTLTLPGIDASPFPIQDHDHYPPLIHEDEELGSLFSLQSFEESKKNGVAPCCKLEMEQGSSNVQIFNVNNYSCGGSNSSNKGGVVNNKRKKLEGQPSKNLMAERRRRKRLNDRLSMLRSIVPKISKMDRTSILGDTIDYMKDLLERINKLQEGEESEAGKHHQVYTLTNLKEPKQNEAQVRNSPKFEVERSEIDTRIDICCAPKPGLLLSTVNTLEALGLDVQQCVISCFNDFSMQASCSEVIEQTAPLSPEDIKQALLRTAGYGGKCNL